MISPRESSDEDVVRCSRIMTLSFVFAIIFGAWGMIRWLTIGVVDAGDDLWFWGLVLSLSGPLGPVLLSMLWSSE